MSVNVNRSVSDQFYRYKMPRLIAKVTAHWDGLLSLYMCDYRSGDHCVDSVQIKVV